jgi:hypothetical protein
MDDHPLFWYEMTTTSRKPHVAKNPRFNGIANAAHCHPNKFALPKACHKRDGLCSETGI